MRELRHGWKHFAVFVVCLILGVAVIGSVGGFGAVVSSALQSQARSLLGGDIEVRLRGQQATDAQREFLRSYGEMSYVATMRTMLYHGEESTLVEVKAVDAAYPLVGALELGEGAERSQALADNGVVVDPILLSQLALNIGDEISIGSGQYIIRATLKKEPDRAVQFFGFGPRVMMSHVSLERSGLVNQFSLIEHRYRINSPAGTLVDDAFEASMETELKQKFPDATWRVRTGTDGNATIERFTSQLLSFLQLSGLATFLIAGIGIGSSARAYLEKKLPTIAIFKTLGASRRDVRTIYVIVLAALAILSGLVGMALAILIVSAAVPMLVPILPILESYSLSPWPFLLAIWYGVLIAYLFSMPALLSALGTRPALLFRSKAGTLLFRFDREILQVVSALAALLLATLILTAHDTGFMMGAIAVIALAFVLFALCAKAVRSAAKRVHVRAPWLKLALGNMHRPGSTTGTVIFAIGISLSVLIALTLTEANFQQRITQLVEEDAPSLFMIDIQPHQQAELKETMLQYADEEQIMLYPMVRGRIVAINGKAITENDVGDEVRWAVRGDRGISTSRSLPENATISAGTWWPEDYSGEPLISVDERFMQGMGLKIGSTITLNILGEDIVATVASARNIDYTTLQLNFSLMLSPGTLEAFPRSYLSTVHLKGDNNQEGMLVRRITQNLPGITIIRTTEVVELIREAVTYIGIALRVTVAISLLAGVLVLVSALSATIEQRLYDTAVLKVLGARKADILKSCTTEWLLLALVTSLIAAVIGTFSAWLIGERFRSTNFYLLPELTLLTIAACMVVIWVTGYLGNKRLFNLRPSAMLRND